MSINIKEKTKKAKEKSKSTKINKKRSIPAKKDKVGNKEYIKMLIKVLEEAFQENDNVILKYNKNEKYWPCQLFVVIIYF
jgi:hypothetical protein